MLEARRSVQQLKQYRPPLAGRTGMRLDFNENTVGTSPRVLEKLRQISADDLSRYPEREPVEKIAASFLQIDSRELLLTNGIDEAIHLLCQTYLEENDEVFVVVPTFAMYELFAAATGAKIACVAAESDFQFPTESLLSRITPRTRLIAIANPNNPTGSVALPEDLLRVARAAPDAAVLIDEAYFEFYGQTLLREIRRHSNLFVARTFSKAYGMAGLRLGLLAGCAEQMNLVRKVTSPYNVNAAALACLPAALEDEAFLSSYVAEIQRGRNRLQEAFRSLGIPYWPSRANFVLAKIGPLHREFVAEMGRRGILIRDRSTDPGCEGCVRITIGTANQMDQLLAVLEPALTAIGFAERSLA